MQAMLLGELRARWLLLVLCLFVGSGFAQTADTQQINDLRQKAFAAELEGEHSEAGDFFARLCKEDPEDSRWFLRASDNYGKAGRFNDAVRILMQGRKQFSDVPELGVMLCKTFHLKAESMQRDGVFDDNVLAYYENAAQVAKELLELNAVHLEALLGLAQAEFALGQLDAAEATAGRAIAAHPGAPGGHIIVGRIHLKRFIDAKTNLNQAGDRAANRAELAKEVQRLRALADGAFESANAADPGRAYPLVALGDIAAWMGEYEAAFAEYRKAMSIDPQAPIKHDWLRQNTDVDLRVTLYDSVRESYLQSTDPSAQAIATVDWYRALARFDKGNWREAASLFESTLEPLPEIADSYYYLLQSVYWSGDEAACMQYSLAFARKNRTRFADLARNDLRCLAILRIMAKKSFESEKFEDSRDLNHVMAFASQSAADWNNYAFLCRKTGKFEEAFLGYQMALSDEPNSPQLMNDAAVILQHDLKGEENLAEARKLYEQAIAVAEKMLAEGDLSEEEKARTEKALSDAKLNLAEMVGG